MQWNQGPWLPLLTQSAARPPLVRPNVRHASSHNAPSPDMTDDLWGIFCSRETQAQGSLPNPPPVLCELNHPLHGDAPLRTSFNRSGRGHSCGSLITSQRLREASIENGRPLSAHATTSIPCPAPGSTVKN